MGDFIAGKFRTVPDWVLESSISDGALRLYMVMLQFADNTTGQAYPGRKLLAERLGKTEKSVDRYIDELESIRAVTVEARWKPGSTTVRASNLYHLHHVPGVATPVSPPSPQGCPHPPPADVAGTRTNELEPMNNTASRPPKPRFAYPDAFETFWSTYPLRKEKRKAYEAWAKATKEVGENTVLQGAKAYAHDAKRLSEPRFTKHPTTWLNQGCWDDDYTETRKEKAWNPWS